MGMAEKVEKTYRERKGFVQKNTEVRDLGISLVGTPRWIPGRVGAHLDWWWDPTQVAVPKYSLS
jgi:hypothetical protein